MNSDLGALRESDDLMDHSESTSMDDEEGDSGSATGTSTSFPGGGHQDAANAARRKEIIAKEEKRVREARYALIVTFIVCACAVVTAVYVSSKNNEYDVFVKKVRYTGHTFVTV